MFVCVNSTLLIRIYGLLMSLFTVEKSDKTYTLSIQKSPFSLFRHTLLLQHFLFTDIWSPLEMGLCRVLWASLWSWLNSFWHYWIAQIAILTTSMILAFRCTWKSDWLSYYIWQLGSAVYACGGVVQWIRHTAVTSITPQAPCWDQFCWGPWDKGQTCRLTCVVGMTISDRLDFTIDILEHFRACLVFYLHSNASEKQE